MSSDYSHKFNLIMAQECVQWQTHNGAYSTPCASKQKKKAKVEQAPVKEIATPSTVERAPASVVNTSCGGIANLSPMAGNNEVQDDITTGTEPSLM